MPDKRDSPEPGQVRVGIIYSPPNAKILVIAGRSLVYTLPDRPNQVVKVPQPYDDARADHEIERRVYHRLGEHRNLVKVIEMDEYGIYLERASHGNLREYYTAGGETTLHEKLIWCHNVALAVEYVHQKNIHHADLSGQNLLLDSAKNILLCDFSGSSIDGEKATI